MESVRSADFEGRLRNALAGPHNQRVRLSINLGGEPRDATLGIRVGEKGEWQLWRVDNGDLNTRALIALINVVLRQEKMPASAHQACERAISGNKTGWLRLVIHHGRVVYAAYGTGM